MYGGLVGGVFLEKALRLRVCAFVWRIYDIGAGSGLWFPWCLGSADSMVFPPF